MPRRYTPQEDALIRAARLDQLTGLAERLGRQRYNILNRRTRLLRGDYDKPRPKPEPPRVRHASDDVLIGRPQWFDDFGLLHNRLRAGR